METEWHRGFSDGIILSVIVVAVKSWIEEWAEKKKRERDGGGE
jgi:hypothetical protein